VAGTGQRDRPARDLRRVTPAAQRERNRSKDDVAALHAQNERLRLENERLRMLLECLRDREADVLRFLTDTAISGKAGDACHYTSEA
jgi:hypothetical protein